MAFGIILRAPAMVEGVPRLACFDGMVATINTNSSRVNITTTGIRIFHTRLARNFRFFVGEHVSASPEGGAIDDIIPILQEHFLVMNRAY